MNLDLSIIEVMTISAVAVVPIIVALTQLFKYWIPTQFIPFISLGLGILITFLLADNFQNDIGGTILTGILFGLSASGLYSNVKSSAHTLNSMKRKKIMKYDKLPRE
jgi:hypothetical protein